MKRWFCTCEILLKRKLCHPSTLNISLVSGILSCPNRKKPLRRIQLITPSRPSKKNRAQFYSSHEKSILLHNSTRTSGGAGQNLETLNWIGFMIITCSDRWHYGCQTSISYHTKKPKIGSVREKMKRSSGAVFVCF